MVMPEPVVVVDVLSPGTKMVDTTRKLEGYFKLASVRHYPSSIRTSVRSCTMRATREGPSQPRC
jgi:hypothetical protein